MVVVVVLLVVVVVVLLLLVVMPGELQAFGLGLDACALDRETGEAVVNEKGELVCRQPFVAAPVCFFGDDEKQSKYRGAYFEDGGARRLAS